MLQRIDDALWVHREPKRAGGIELGRTMTVARLPDHTLWVHGPTACTSKLRRMIDALGPVRWIVAPNRIHTNYYPEWAAAYPEARFLGTSGLEQDFPTWPLNGSLLGRPPPEWRGVLRMLLVDGMPRLNEVVFLHRPSRTLIVADLVFNLPPQTDLWARIVLGLAGTNGRLACSRLLRMMIRDRAAFARSVRTLLTWDFRRVIVGHGAIVSGDARQRLARAFGAA